MVCLVLTLFALKYYGDSIVYSCLPFPEGKILISRFTQDITFTTSTVLHTTPTIGHIRRTMDGHTAPCNSPRAVGSLSLHVCTATIPRLPLASLQEQSSQSHTTPGALALSFHLTVRHDLGTAPPSLQLRRAEASSSLTPPFISRPLPHKSPLTNQARAPSQSDEASSNERHRLIE